MGQKQKKNGVLGKEEIDRKRIFIGYQDVTNEISITAVQNQPNFSALSYLMTGQNYLQKNIDS